VSTDVGYIIAYIGIVEYIYDQAFCVMPLIFPATMRLSGRILWFMIASSMHVS
jgi:hypothetical protein